MTAIEPVRERGHEGGVIQAVWAVLADMEDRQSLIPVHEEDREYDVGCVVCLLRKNGYLRLAQLVAGSGPDGGHA